MGATGAAGSANGWHVAHTVTGVHSYHNFNETTLTAPAPVTFGGELAAVEFAMAIDSEPTFDFLYVDYSTNGGTTWTEAGHFDGNNGYPDYSPAEVRFANPGAPALIRFRFKSDELLSSPVYLGVSLDRIAYASYPNAPPSETENLPLTGPVPPPSAGATGLSAPATRAGPASASDIAAGTGACVVDSLGPDLRVTNVVASDRRGRDGKQVVFTATVRNAGDMAAGASTTEFELDGATVIANEATSGLAAGAFTNVTATWTPRDQAGDHTLTVTADSGEAVLESDEANNSSRFTFTVRGNRIENGSFEASSSGIGPDGWSGSSTGAGTASWTEGGSEGAHSASLTGNGGNALVHGSPTWTSNPVTVTPGEALELAASVRTNGVSSAPTAGLIYLGAAGEVLQTVRLLTAPLATNGFTSLSEAVTIPAGVAQVRVVLTGFAPTDLATRGTVTFDEVGLFEL